MERFRLAMQERTSWRDARTPCVVAFGDSVTEGGMAMGVNDFEAAYHQQWRRLMAKRYPQVPLNVINSGIGGDTAERACLRVDRDVIRFRPDLVLIGFGLNDSQHGRPGLERFGQALAHLVHRIDRETGADLVLVTSNFMNRHEDVTVHPDHQALRADFASRQCSGLLGEYAEVVRSVAERFGVAVADVYEDWQAMADAGIDTDAMLANGLNHPDRVGHAVAARRLMITLEPDWVSPPLADWVRAIPAAGMD